MKKNFATIGFTLLLAAALGLAQSSHKVQAKIPHDFTAVGKVLPAGEYTFVYDAAKRVVTIRSTEKGAVGMMPIVTLLSGAIHSSPSDSHVVFDKIGNNYFLSEIWIPGIDGVSLLSTREKHEHEVLDVPL